MDVWDKLSAEQQEFLVALPYRTGLWISQCDQTGGQESSAQELAALETIVISFAEDFCKSEFVENLMRKTLAQREIWSQWQDNMTAIPADVRRAVDMLAPLLERKDITSFKQTLIEIGTAVAEAYRESDHEDEDDDEGDYGFVAEIRDHIRAAMERLTGRWNSGPAARNYQFSNISKTERAALAELTTALRPDEPEGLPPAGDDEAA